MNKNSHLTIEKDFVINKTKYTQENSSDKPDGLWYQINDSWKEWCKYEMPQWLGPNSRGAYKVNIEIDKTNVLVIQTLEAFDSFHNKYRALHPYHYKSTYINWERVSEEYDGIEISDYFYEKRMNNNCEWYYTWDVASGCIWNTNIIKVIGEITETETEKQKSLWEV